MNSRWTASFRAIAYRAVALCLVLPTVTLVGCSGSGGKVTGKVTSGGQAVTGGSITFNPVPAEGSNEAGIPAAGEVKADGTYTLANQAGGGATVGKNRVLYQAPPSPGGSPVPGQPAPLAPYANLVPKQTEVEVKSGTNTIDIELVPPGQAGK